MKSRKNLMALICVVVVSTVMPLNPASVAATTDTTAVAPTDDTSNLGDWTAAGPAAVKTAARDDSLIYHAWNEYGNDPCIIDFDHAWNVGSVYSVTLQFYWYSYSSAAAKVEIFVDGTWKTVTSSYNPPGPPCVETNFSVTGMSDGWTEDDLENFQVRLSMAYMGGNTFGVDQILLIVEYEYEYTRDVPTDDTSNLGDWIAAGPADVKTAARDDSLIYHAWYEYGNDPCIIKFAHEWNEVDVTVRVTSVTLQFYWYSYYSERAKVEIYVDGTWKTVTSSYDPPGPPCAETNFPITGLSDGWTEDDLENFQVRLSIAFRCANTLGVDQIRLLVELEEKEITLPASSGSWGSGQLYSPMGIAVDSSDYVYVSDFGNDRVVKYTSGGSYITSWGSDTLDGPWGITLDGTGYVYVADHNNNRVVKYTSSGSYVTSWGSDRLNLPTSITIDNAGYLYVASAGFDEVVKYTTSGTFVTSWGGFGYDDGHFLSPWGITADDSGYIYVSDVTGRVQKFTVSGAFIVSWGASGTGDGQFNIPSSITVDNNSGYIHVTDYGNGRVQAFSPNGDFIASWGNDQLSNPSSITVDSNGYIYVTDAGTSLVQVFQ
ncbi:MAG: hypothetical protein ACFFD4_28900 [Candidatus Odinarchaeota archaeon]